MILKDAHFAVERLRLKLNTQPPMGLIILRLHEQNVIAEAKQQKQQMSRK